jgi:hypothetical protein
MTKRPYTTPGRLSDVLALIQVLALDEDTHRSEDGITRELQGPPHSSPKWNALAIDHPEFFRVKPTSERGLSLAARHVLPRGENEHHPQLSPEFTATLLHTAIDLHDRQLEAQQWWKPWLAAIGAIVGALIGAGSALLALYLNGWCKP